MKRFEGKRVLVTGGSGFIASHLCRRLLAEGAELLITTKYNSIIDNIRLADIWEQLKPIEADLRNPDSLKKVAASKPDIIYHFAAYNHVGDSFQNVAEAIDSNAKGTVNLLEAYDGFKRFVYISTSEIYGYQSSVPFAETMLPFPVSPYSVGKYTGELYARMKHHVFRLPIVVLRPFNAFGPFQSLRAVVAEMVMKCLSGEDLVMTEGIQTRDFNYVENLVDAFIPAGFRKGIEGEVINVGSGREITIRDLALKIHSLTGSKSRLGIGELPYRPTEIWRMMADNRKANDLLGWTPRVDLDEGLRRTVNWYREFRHIIADSDSPLAQLCSREP